MLSATFYLAIMIAPVLTLTAAAAAFLAIGAIVSHVRGAMMARDVAAFLEGCAAGQLAIADATEARIDATIARTSSYEATRRMVAAIVVGNGSIDPTDAPAFPSPDAFPVIPVALPTLAGYANDSTGLTALH